MKILFRLLLILTVAVLPSTMRGQRIVRELESNTDLSIAEDSTLDNKKKMKNIPAEVKSWTIDQYGNRNEIEVDTLRHLYQNNEHSEGANGSYNTLGNLGSPRLSRIYMNRRQDTNFFFAQPFDQFITWQSDFRFFNTKSPYMNLSYNWCGSKNTGFDHFKALYTNNAGKRFNIGGLFDYMYGQGYYDKQSTSFMNATGWFSYLGDKYDVHFRYTHNYMKMAENGGLEDDRYITNPEAFPQRYSSDQMPVKLSQTWNKQEHDFVHLLHRYHIGFYRNHYNMKTEGDSTFVDSASVSEEFVPVTSIFHRFSLESYRRRYVAHEAPKYYHSYNYLPGDSASDKHSMAEFKNLVGLSLHEGFNKYALAGINAYVGFINTSYQMPDTMMVRNDTVEFRHKYKENDIVVGGQLIRTQGTWIHYQADAEFFVAGDNAGEIHLSGKGELNFPLLGDTAQVVVDAQFNRAKPSFFYDHLHSKHLWWENECSAFTQTRIGGEIHLPKTNTHLEAHVENIKNYAYLANEGPTIVKGDNTYYTNNIVVKQCSENVQIISATLRQNFKLGIFHLDNDFTFQTCTHDDVLPLPKISTYHNLYIDFKIAKVLSCEIGADLKYFTEYYAPDYSPVVSNFTTQNPNNRIKIGNYPLISAYANFSLKRTRFYVQYYHANQSTGRYFWAPHYPMNPKGIHFGISWNFYD